MAPDPPGIDPHADPFHGDPIGSDNNTLPRLPNSEIGKTLYPKLADHDNFILAGRTTKGVPLEYIATFEEGYRKISPAADDVAEHHRDIWADIGNALRTAQDQFKTAIERLQGSGQFTGATAAAMFQKASDSLNYLGSLADAANRMDPLVDTFSRDIKETKDWFELMYPFLQPGQNSFVDVGTAALDREQVIAYLNQQAQRVIQTFYNPPIEWVSQGHPDMSASPPQINGRAGGAGTPAFAGMPPGGGPSPGGLGLPTPMGTSLPGVGPQDSPAGQPTAPANALQGLGDTAKGAGDAANNAGQQAQNAAGQGANAANQALGQGLNGAQKGTAGLPEGVLGLGPKGLRGATTGSGSAGGGRGGGAGGTGAREPALSKPSAQLTQASKAITAAQASRAGVSTGAGGGGGAGAPVAGQRGAGGADKEHKASKALRHTKHGEEVIGETDAVVPVIGDTSEESRPTRSS